MILYIVNYKQPRATNIEERTSCLRLEGYASTNGIRINFLKDIFLPDKELRQFCPKEIIGYCSVYSCCYATIARRNMRCLVTAGKHVNNTRAIARQLLGKRVPAATDIHTTVEVLLDYNNGNSVFCVVRAEIL
jgi:hypothetical protein